MDSTHVTSEGELAFEFADDLFIIDGGRVVVREDALARGVTFRPSPSGGLVDCPRSSLLTARAVADRLRPRRA